MFNDHCLIAATDSMASRKRQKASQFITRAITLPSFEIKDRDKESATADFNEISTKPAPCPKHSIRISLQGSYLFEHKKQLDKIRVTQAFEHVGNCRGIGVHIWNQCACDRILQKTRFFPVLHHVQVARNLESSPEDILTEIACLLENKIPLGADGDMIVEIAVAFAYIMRRSTPEARVLLERHITVKHVLNLVKVDCGKQVFRDKDRLESLVFEFVREERLPPTLHTHNGLLAVIHEFFPDSSYLRYINASVLRYLEYVAPFDSFHRQRYSSIKIIATKGNGYISSHSTEYVPALYTGHGIFLRRAYMPLCGAAIKLAPGESVEFYASYSGSEAEYVCAECALQTTDVTDGPLRLRRYNQVFMRCPLDHAFGNPVEVTGEGDAVLEMMDCAVTQGWKRVLLKAQKLSVSIFDIVKVFRLHPSSSGIGGIWPVVFGENGITIRARDGGLAAGVTLQRASRIKLSARGYILGALICGEERFTNGETKRWAKNREREKWNSGNWVRGAVYHELLG